MTTAPSYPATASRTMSLWAPAGFPLVEPGMDLVELVLGALRREGIALAHDDVVVFAQKVVSKAEGRLVNLAEVVPSARARELANVCGKDPRLIEVILGESAEVVRCVRGLIVVRHKLGFVVANAGVDQSNVQHRDGKEWALLLPEYPNHSARRYCEGLRAATGTNVGVAIIDSWGRAWRVGTCGACIGAYGLATTSDLRGQPDIFGRELQTTIVGVGDELAAAASLLMGQAAEGTPLVIVRGTRLVREGGSAGDLVRPYQEDLFK